MNGKTLGIRVFLKQFTDERLAALFAHTQDGKLAFYSCCCIAGSINAPHPLKTYHGGMVRSTLFGIYVISPESESDHYREATKSPYASRAETEFFHLGENDEQRCENLLPIIQDELNLRASKKEVAAEIGVSA